MRHITEQDRRRHQGRALDHEQIDQGDDAPLRDHGERQHQDQGRKQIDQLGRELDHPTPSKMLTSSPITANKKAVPRNSGTRKIRILALAVSIMAIKTPPKANLMMSTGSASNSASGAWASATPHGKNSAKPMQE